MGSKPTDVYYQAAVGSRYTDEDVSKFGPALLEMVSDRQAELCAADIVEAAKDKSSPLHEYIYKHDDKTAAHLYRETQARDMIRSVTICWVDKVGKKEVERRTRLFEFVRPPEPVDEEEYEAPAPSVRPGRRTPVDRRTKRVVTTNYLISNEDLLAQKLEEAALDMQRFRDRYEHYYDTYPEFKKKFAGVWKVIQNL